jgi:cytochrome P450
MSQPERFDDARESGVPKCAYLPFGMGPHKCTWQIFATMEMHVILTMVLQRSQMILEPGQEIVPDTVLNQYARDGVRMQVEMRQSAAAAD